VTVQSDDLPLSTWIVAPSSTGRREATFRPEIEIDGVKTRVVVEQLTIVDPETRLGDFAGRLDAAELRAVDAALWRRWDWTDTGPAWLHGSHDRPGSVPVGDRPIRCSVTGPRSPSRRNTS